MSVIYGCHVCTMRRDAVHNYRLDRFLAQQNKAEQNKCGISAQNSVPDPLAPFAPSESSKHRKQAAKGQIP